MLKDAYMPEEHTAHINNYVILAFSQKLWMFYLKVNILISLQSDFSEHYQQLCSLTTAFPDCKNVTHTE